MSQEELVQAYLQGNLSRRTFIRRLVATGITLSAAVAYTHALRPTLAQAAVDPDLYEAPTVITKDATELAGESARLNGDVDPNGYPTTVWFEFGETTAYGVRTPDETISGDGLKPVGSAIIGLDPGRTYHFRVVASNQTGQATGDDRTLAIPDSAAPQVAISPVDTDIDSVRKSGVVRVLVSCDEAVSLKLEGTIRSGKKRVVAATGSLTVDPEGDRAAQLKLTKAGKKALKKAERAKLAVRAEATDLAGNTGVSQASVRLA